MEECRTQSCWEPNTPVKSGSMNLQPICEDSSDPTNFSGKDDGGIHNWQAALLEKPLPDATSTTLRDLKPTSNPSGSIFSSEFKGTRFEASFETPLVDNKFIAVGQNMWINSHYVPSTPNGDPTPSGNSSDLNSPCKERIDATPSGNSSSLFAPITPDQSKRTENSQTCSNQTPEDQLANAAAPTEVVENHNPDIDQQKTPQKKPRRKKHRPKVVREGQAKRVRKPATPKPEKNKETPTGKRKYVRKNETSKAESLLEVAPQDAENKETPTGKRKYVRKNETSKTENLVEVAPQDSENKETPKVKRKHVRKNGTDKTQSLPEVAPQDLDNKETPKVKRKYVRKNGTDKSHSLPEVAPQDSENKETPKVKRKYVRKSVDKTQEISTGELLRKFADTKKETHGRKSCKKRLNFDENNSFIEENSASIPGSNEIGESEAQNFHIGAEPKLPAQLGQGLELMDGNTKTDPMGVQEKEIKKGKCRIVFSDKTHDKEEPFLEMLMNYNKKPAPSLKGSDFSNMACIGEEEEANGLKRGYDKEEPIVEMLINNNTKPAPSLKGSDFSNMTCIGLEEEASGLERGYDKEESIVEMQMNNSTKPAPSLNNSNFSNLTCIGAGEEASGLKRGNDREEPVVEMLVNNNTKSTPRINGSNFTSMSSIGVAEATRGSKRGCEYITNGEGQRCTNVIGCHFNSLSKYKELFPAYVYDGNGISDMHVSTVSKSKKPKRRQSKTTSKASSSKSSRAAAEQNANNFTPHKFNNADMNSCVAETSYLYPAAQLYPSTCQTQTLSFNAQPQQKEFEHQLLLEQETMMTGMGCNIAAQVCSFSSLIETVESNQLPFYIAGGASPVGESQINQGAHSSLACVEIKVSEKRKTGNNRKKNRGVARKKNPTVDDITEYLKHLNIDPKHKEKNALVLYNGDGAVVPFEGPFNPIKKSKRRAKVDLDAETDRVWRLLLENINSEGIDGTDEEKEKWWESERRVFQGRADSFIARMHLVQGDRRFTPWKGSVVDSVVGVYLTQNVSDHASSSAFMSLAAHFPIKTEGSFEQCSKETEETVKEQKEQILEQKDTVNNSPDPIGSYTSFMELLQMAESQTGVQDGESGYMSSYTENVRHFMYQSEGSTQKFDHGLYNQNTCTRPITHPIEEVPSYERLREESPSSLTRNGSEENCASEHSEVTVESASQDTVRKVMNECLKTEQISADVIKCNSSQEQATNLCKECLDTVNSCIIDTTQNTEQKQTESSMTEPRTTPSTSVATSELKKGSSGKKKQTTVDWDILRLKAEENGKRERTANTMDSLDWEAVRRADVHEVAATIKERGMNNVLAGRIQDFLDRIVTDHGSIDLEWLRDVPPDKAKEYLLSIRGLGLKSVECVRLLTLHHLAFPVDVNVGRIAVRLGWVPLQTLPESLQLHLLELYPVMEHIQQYLWPRLCKLDQRTLYELHYQMITFGKVFCTKSKPNCNACPMRGDCRHFASAFASARLALPGPEEKSIVSATANREAKETPIVPIERLQLPEPQASQELLSQSQVHMCQPTVEVPTSVVEEPIIEVPNTPEPEVQFPESDIEDAFPEDPEEIPTIRLNLEKFTQNLQSYMEHKMELQDGDVSKALVAITQEAASIPMPKLKNVNQLRTEHQVYELPDSHPLLEGLDKREPDDPCSYLLAIWTPGETANSIEQPESRCSFQDSGNLCEVETCFSCNSIRETNTQTVRGTLLIPCRTAMRGSFPLNGTYFQVNEVFADHASSINPIDVPRSWIWNLPRRVVYFGTSIPTIFKGLSTESIQYCFWRGFVCVRGFDQKKRAPRPLMARLHFPASKLPKASGKTDKKKG